MLQSQKIEGPSVTYNVTGGRTDTPTSRLNIGGQSTSIDNCAEDVPIYEKSYLYLYTPVDNNKLCKELSIKNRHNSICFAQVMSSIHTGPVTNGFCTYHDYILHNRKYILTKSNGVDDIIPVAVKSISPMTVKSIGMLFSFFLSNDNKIYEKLLTNNEAFALTDNVNKVENEVKNICKAMSVLLDERQYNKPEYAQLMATYKLWAQENNELFQLENWNKMYFIMEVDENFYNERRNIERFKSQLWFQTAEKVTTPTMIVYILYVPFTFLCDFDKIRLASLLPSTLLEECREPNKYSYGFIPNVTFFNGIIQIGGGAGIIYDCPVREEGYYHRFTELVALITSPTFKVDLIISGFESKPSSCQEPKVGELERHLNKPVVTKYIYRR